MEYLHLINNPTCYCANSMTYSIKMMQIHLTMIFVFHFVLFLSSSNPSTYFASPADPLPDTEIDEHPCNGECDS